MKKSTCCRPLEQKITSSILRQEVLNNWQRRVDNDLSNHQVMEMNGLVRTWKIYHHKGWKHLTRLITGHHFLNSFQSKINPNKISKSCNCGQIESLHHFLFTCQKYTRYRQKWFKQIYNITGNPTSLTCVSYKTAFGQREDLSADANSKLQASTCQYILETKRFI